jgi:hypothetical protein
MALPFFPCPDCDEELALFPGDPSAAADTLNCAKCGWNFAGWTGSKVALASHPPALFLTITESLHQWMQNRNMARCSAISSRSPLRVRSSRTRFTSIHTRTARRLGGRSDGSLGAASSTARGRRLPLA